MKNIKTQFAEDPELNLKINSDNLSGVHEIHYDGFELDLSITNFNLREEESLPLIDVLFRGVVKIGHFEYHFMKILKNRDIKGDEKYNESNIITLVKKLPNPIHNW